MSTLTIALAKGRILDETLPLFAQAHLLTMAESAVLRGLCSGSRPAEIAERTGVAISTVRTHIGNIRAKTGSQSVRDLIRMVTVLPPIVPAFNRLN